MTDPFRWRSDGGHGLRINPHEEQVVAHEVLYEDSVTHIKESPLFVGSAIPRGRLAWFGTACAVIVAALVGRAFWMQILKGSEYQGLAERNRLRHEVVVPRRGIIRDTQGRGLAENVPAFDVQVRDLFLPANREERGRLLAGLGRALGMTVDQIEGVIASSTDMDESVVLQRDVPYDRALAVNILAADAPGVQVAVSSKRKYLTNASFHSLAHVLGYVSGITPEELKVRRDEGYRQVDSVGKTGIESSYETYLRGVPGERLFEVDSRQRITGTVGEKEALDGEDVRLSLDLDVQRAAENALRNELDKVHLRRGVAIAMNPQDGALIAAVSLPGFDDNIFAGTVSSTQYKALLDDPDRPLLARAWGGVYPSGSTVKPVVATAALTEHVVTPETTVLSTGGLRVGAWFFPDWKAGGHGVTNVRRAIAWSVNTYFYTVGGGYGNIVGLGIDRLVVWFHRFGLGARTGIDVPGEGTGFVPSPEWKQKTKHEQWYIGDTYNVSIGQGDLLVTPLQVALYTAEVANGGYPITPHFALSHGRAGETTQAFSFPRAKDPVAPSEVIEVVRSGMRDTVVYGSGRALADLPFPAAGKTGTAQWRADKANHAWFTAFAPFDKPEIVVTVLVEEGEEGSRTAVPVAKEILKAWWAKKTQNPPAIVVTSTNSGR